MITREDFIAKVNSFNLGEEQTNKCIEYYDNPSKSVAKEKVVDEANAEDLVKTVNKWYGIKHSTKEKKPRTTNKANQVEKQKEEINKLVGKIIDIIKETESTTLLNHINIHCCGISQLTKEKVDKIENDKKEKYNQALKLLNEYGKATGRHYKIVLDD